MNKYIIPITIIILGTLINGVEANNLPPPPKLSIITDQTTVTLSWDSSINAAGYTLYYAPFPDANPIGSIDIGTQTTWSTELWDGAAFYVALKAYNQAGQSDLSNIESFNLTPVSIRSKDQAIFDYTAAFNGTLATIGPISPLDFSHQFASDTEYLSQISWDVTTAAFWDEFNTQPAFHLNSKELALFKKNGFVVSERLGKSSFADMFYQIYSADLPVLVTTDAVLHAWHRSYDAMLKELEENYLILSLETILDGMAEQIPSVWTHYQNKVLSESITDADYFLAVARSLLLGQTVASHLNQNERVTETLAFIQAEQLQDIELFGRKRSVDFSQFKVRGHYEDSEILGQYFRTMMWLSRIDLRVTGDPKATSQRELGAAVILHYLLEKSGYFETWQQFDQVIQTFVGKTDSMDFNQLNSLLAKASIQSPADIKEMSQLENLQAQILAEQLGYQEYATHALKVPANTIAPSPLPRSFTFMGQKFILDAWALSRVVFDNIFWDEKPVMRRIPSSLDIAFSVLGNNAVVPQLVERMTNTQGREFRDGLNYQHNLAAVRTVIDNLPEAIWEESIYTNWLATLRALSSTSTDPRYPQAMRTWSWAMKTVNTQLASWTQLRHDTILYAKQSVTPGITCYYPAGFVEPRLAFWSRFEKMVKLTANLLQNISEESPTGKKSLERQIKFLNNFAQKISTLKDITLKELAQEPLLTEETVFLKDIVEITIDPYGGIKTYSGWYPNLFYSSPSDSDRLDAIVVDVHTDFPDTIHDDPGSILHQGIGMVPLLMMAVDNGNDKMIFAGPVLSHYEFEEPINNRLSDSEWLNQLKAGKIPPQLEWTQNYLVPGEFNLDLLF
jgi:hypothetical protein